MSINKNKPSLNSLFESKKLDLPKDDFWEKLQNDVKGEVFASASRPNISHRILKSTLFTLPIFLIVPFVLQKNNLGYESKLLSNIDNISIETSLNSSENVRQNRSILQSLEESEYDLLVTNTDFVEIDLETSSFVVKTLKLEQPESFETQFLNNKEYRPDDLFARFTF
tara:strand:+ start:2010 stop:2513 length:504 start_codon:yes stop_codon:yes gene_type:complete